MDGELFVAMEVPITLVFTMAVLSIIFTVIGVVRGGYQSYATHLDMEVTTAYDSELEELCNYGKPLPATTVFATLSKNAELIANVSGSGKTLTGTTVTINGASVTDQISSLSGLFDAKVRINATKDAYGLYTVTVQGG